MFKLLTEEERNKVVHEYNMRRAIVILYALILIFVVGIIGLLPSYVLSNARQTEILERTRIIDKSILKGDEPELQKWLTQINNKLEVLSPKLDTDRPSDFIEKMLEQKISGIFIDSISWTNSEGKRELSVSGTALNRQTLVTFKDSINDSGYFSSVTLPISNLTQDTDINFQIKFSPKEPPITPRTSS
ncbi:MAG: hypothetical protein UT07_C0014G0014 [Parcubacteria group bacterium GW2011_GWB1_38_8]|uniref:Uncharacterized protein n=1 Tax=Candidatus Zambryskibacteria bacterium RIFCSPLOWO2_02_FULL_39_14 TaxID=1802769 RepID=A0A1G2UHY0_9BACT|nr:MAG: hypothetical protein UT07_C0014G0014 [Parcubacteria group bacterium GW2011_GWB1_38_8]KKR29768.1 MAG: hypothetical protein UT62_C0030G0007 [Parcubacteria group bacterium GW2011_GWC1_39_8]OHA95890.1 MAG: hypothetical protein A3C62_01855 [Candidatus Zambryskibacteria bacterium RIFCSPHIGHO2_02_FULL_39_16]OHB09018.1 MAG: hypothetical protein A3I86_00730 [Candidatus Zambryskibacteria bacterium RIFCSPLOWO2_02_FULL_39_14]